MKEEVIKRYEYKVSRKHGLLACIAFSVMAVLSVWFALENTEGFTLYSTIELSPFMFDCLFWLIAVLFAFVAFLGLMMFIKSFQKPRFITLGETEMTAPKKPLSQKIITFSYSEMTKMNLIHLSKASHLIIDTPQGRVVVPSVNLERRADFNELVEIIRERAGHSNHHNQDTP